MKAAVLRFAVSWPKPGHSNMIAIILPFNKNVLQVAVWDNERGAKQPLSALLYWASGWLQQPCTFLPRHFSAINFKLQLDAACSRSDEEKAKCWWYCSRRRCPWSVFFAIPAEDVRLPNTPHAAKAMRQETHRGMRLGCPSIAPHCVLIWGGKIQVGKNTV